MLRKITNSLVITDVYNGTDNPNNERIKIEVLKKTNLNEYAIIDETFNSSNVKSNLHKHFFRFPNKEVEVGDLIILYSGVEPTVTNSPRLKKFTLLTDIKIHKYYFGTDCFVWNDTGDTVTLLKLSVEDSEKVPAKKK